jgi:tagaturonate epimerase
MDETASPQTPPELLLILAMLADEGVPVQTIAPKFTGRFNKGVDYVGDVQQFEKEFRADLAVIEFAVQRFGLPEGLKLSVHSGSDKFSIYGPIRRAITAFGAGLHLKTAGTTWLEEVIGLAEAGGDGLALAKEIYARALKKKDELCGPYASVIDIDTARLPSAETVAGWTSGQFVSALRHDPTSPAFNPHLRQLVHVGFKVAAQMGDRYLALLKQCEPTIAKNVTENLYQRHLKPLFVDK